jgi:SAM-dependent methyltransferase
MTAPYFNKYDRKGAYHWEDYYGGLRRMNAYTRARYDIVLECVREANIPRDGRVLEVGCGDGALTGVLHSRLGLPVTGVDTSEKGLALARQMFARAGFAGEFKLIESYDTGFKDACFAMVVCSDVIEHVDDPRAMLQEIMRVLLPGGRLVITTPIRFSENPVDPMHVQEWFVIDFIALCREMFGEPLKVIQSHPILWYELVSSGRRWVNRAGRLLTNLLTRLGRNPFTEQNGAWRCYTTQTLVLVKPSTAEPHPGK